jgi:hypothetical protein
MITEEMRNQAWQSVVDNYCGDCRGFERRCVSQDTCEGFQQELKDTLEEWEANLVVEAWSLTEPKGTENDS